MTQTFHDELIESIPHLRAFARLLTRNADRADDLVQEALTRALAAQHQYAPGTNFRAWVFTILRNAYLSEIRRKDAKTGSLDESPAINAAVPASQDKRLAIRDLRAALGQLRPEQREALILVGASGMSYEDAARVCHCAVGTIKSRLSRARTELAAVLAGTPGSSDDPPSPPGSNPGIEGEEERLALSNHHVDALLRQAAGEARLAARRARRPMGPIPAGNTTTPRPR